MLDKFLCENCYKRFKNLLYVNTTSYELYASIVCILWGIGLLLPDKIFPPGIIFGKEVTVTNLFNITQMHWAVTLLVSGILRICALIAESIRVKKILSLIILYLWMLLTYYMIKYNYVSIIAPIQFSVMTIFSALTYLSLWKYRK